MTISSLFTYRNFVMGGAALLASKGIHNRSSDRVYGNDRFSRHTSTQQQKHLFSGMHDPFIPSLDQQSFVSQNFPELAHLLPPSLESFQMQQVLDISVKIESLSKCPVHFNSRDAGVVAVGGPPALMSAVYQRDVTFIHAEQKHPIDHELGFCLEWDAESESLIECLPTQFLADQIFRAFHYESLSQAEKTGEFSCRSLDWIGWLKHPKHWGEGIRIALAFQKAAEAFADPNIKALTLKEASDRTQANERFYMQLDKELNGRLLSSESGSILVARTPEEKESLFAMKSRLEKRGRVLTFLSKEEIILRYGFVPPNGIAFAEKPQDKVLSSNFAQLLADRVDRLGGKVIKGTLTTIYVDNPQDGGVVLYNEDGKDRYLPFSRLVVSLENQQILAREGQPLFDIVASRGVSVLALAHVPKSRALPSVIVCGGTNRVTKLAEPVEVQEKNGEIFDVYLVQMTAGSCITPSVSSQESANYDATAAIGLISMAKETLDCELEVLTVYGCNRQVNQYGQSHWLSLQSPGKPKPRSTFAPRGQELDMGTSRFPHLERGVFIQMGSEEGGLSQAPAQSCYSED